MAIKVITYNVNTSALTGTGTINITIPGTFGGTDPSMSGFSGRRLVKFSCWFEGRAAGDQIIALQIQDQNNVLPSPATGSTVSLLDQGFPSTNRAISFPISGPFQIDFPTDPVLPSYKKTIVASQLVIVVTGQKAIIGIDTLVVNLAIDDFS